MLFCMHVRTTRALLIYMYICMLNHAHAELTYDRRRVTVPPYEEPPTSFFPPPAPAAGHKKRSSAAATLASVDDRSPRRRRGDTSADDKSPSREAEHKVGVVRWHTQVQDLPPFCGTMHALLVEVHTSYCRP
jgi:hypothetical protein